MTPFTKFLREIEPILSQRGSAWRKRVLAPMEWNDSTKGQGTGMGQDNGDSYPTCPACGGVHESGSREFADAEIGHRSNCILKKMMERE